MSVKKELQRLGVPKCKNVGKKGPLPRLISDGRTNYPRRGDNEDICFENSQFELFPIDLAIELARMYPQAWCAGGNHFGNYAFEYWFQTMKALDSGDPIPTDSLRWMKKREQYIARHRGDFRLAGVIAMIKWAGFVDGYKGRGDGAENGSSLDYMVELIEDYGR
jgi:hypothetical protein